MARDSDLGLRDGDPTPHWRQFLTVRAVVAGLVIGSALSCIVLHIGLSAGIIPSLNIAASLLGYAALKSWTSLLPSPSAVGGGGGGGGGGMSAQETVVLQTVAVSVYAVAFTGGFGSYLLGMGRNAFINVGQVPGNREQDVVEPRLRVIIPYVLSVTPLGVFLLLQLRRAMVIDYSLPYPSGTATALMIQSLHSTSGAGAAAQQVSSLVNSFLPAFAFAAFKWLFAAADRPGCVGFEGFPTFGLLAARWTWNFDWQLTYVGVGMLSPYQVCYSLALGACLSWGLLWPLVSSKEGIWYPAGLGPRDMGGLYGYQVWLAIAVFLGDGLYNLVKVLVTSGANLMKERRRERRKGRSNSRSRSLGQQQQPPRSGGGGCCDLASGSDDDDDGSSSSAERQRLLPPLACDDHEHDEAEPRVPGSRDASSGGVAPRRRKLGADTPPGDEPGCDGGCRLLVAATTSGCGLPARHVVNTEGINLDEGCSRDGGGGATSTATVINVRNEHASSYDDATAAAAAAAAAGPSAAPLSPTPSSPMDEEERRLRHIFLRDSFPWWLSAAGIAVFGTLPVVAVPLAFPQVRWYMVAAALGLAPAMAAANSYGAGLTDWNMASLYGKVGIFVFASWAGAQGGGVIAGLAVCGVLLATTSVAADLMSDFRTAYLTATPPAAMFGAQLIGTLAGCVVAPLAFVMYTSAFDVGAQGSSYSAPYATLYRAMAVMGSNELALPTHAATFCAVGFAAALLLNGARDGLAAAGHAQHLALGRLAAFIPIPTAIAIPFYVGAQLAVDMAVGALARLTWQRSAPAAAERLVPAVASGLIAGESLFSVPSALLALARVRPPICMSFTPGGGSGGAT